MMPPFKMQSSALSALPITQQQTQIYHGTIVFKRQNAGYQGLHTFACFGECEYATLMQSSALLALPITRQYNAAKFANTQDC